MAIFKQYWLRMARPFNASMVNQVLSKSVKKALIGRSLAQGRKEVSESYKNFKTPFLFLGKESNLLLLFFCIVLSAVTSLACGVEKPMNMFMKFAKNEAGATAIEYGLIAAGIAVVIITAVNTIGNNLSNVFNNVSANVK